MILRTIIKKNRAAALIAILLLLGGNGFARSIGKKDKKNPQRYQPFVAQAEEVTLENLPDGQLKKKTFSFRIYSDSFGRVRRNFTTTVGNKERQKTIHGATINDPVANMFYILDTKTNTLLSKEPIDTDKPSIDVWSVSDLDLYIPILPPHRPPDLGSKRIEGLTCDGYRDLKKGVYNAESWYSRILNRLIQVQVTMENKEVTWRLFNIRLGEPEASLFRISQEYNSPSSTSKTPLQPKGADKSYLTKAALRELETSPSEAEAMLMVRAKMENDPTYITTRDNGFTPLHIAAARGFTALAQYLLAKGAKVDERSSTTWETPLYTAVSFSQKGMVKFLLSRGANIESCDYLGTTPLIMCIHYFKNYDMARFLLESGADVNRSDPVGFPLYYAVQEEQFPIIVLLLDSGANINALGFKGAPLHLAISRNFKSIALYLIERGADINLKTSFEGYTPLHVAVLNNNIYMVLHLLSKGARTDLKDHKGKIPLELASEQDIIRLLSNYKQRSP